MSKNHQERAKSPHAVLFILSCSSTPHKVELRKEAVAQDAIVAELDSQKNNVPN